MLAAHRSARTTPALEFLVKSSKSGSIPRPKGSHVTTEPEFSPMRLRILISVAIGIATGLLCWAVLARFQQSAGDFNWAIWAARDLLAHRNPYDREMQLYPLTVAIFGLPFV